MMKDLSGSWCINGIEESTSVMDSPVPLMHHDPDRQTDHDQTRPDQIKGKHRKLPSLMCGISLAVLLPLDHQSYCQGLVVTIFVMFC